MKIKIITSCSGLDFSYNEGQTVVVSKEIGADLIKVGFAEEVKAVKSEAKTTKVARDTKTSKETGDTKTEIEENKETGDTDVIH